MARRKESVLTQSASVKRTIQFKIDPVLDDALKAVLERIAKEAPDKDFDRNAIVEAALKRGIDMANAELDDLKKRRGNAVGTKAVTGASESRANSE